MYKHRQILPDRILSVLVHVQKHKFRNVSVEHPYTVYIFVNFVVEKDSRDLKLIEMHHKLKTLAVAFMLLLNYLDTLPKLYHNA